MKFVSFLFPLFFALNTKAQIKIYVHQHCGQKPIGIFNHPELTGTLVDSATTLFSIPKPEEPIKLSFYIDTVGFRIEHIWVEPNSLKFDIWLYHCKQYFCKITPLNELSKEDKINSYYIDYLGYRNEDRQQYIKKYNEFMTQYIKEHPNSFLSLAYALNIVGASDEDMIALLKILEPANGQYPSFQKAKNRLLYKNASKIGEPIVNFEALTLTGDTFSTKKLHSARGNVYMFWHAGCAWSKKMFPKMFELQRAYEKKGITFVYFSLDENQNLWEAISKEFSIPANNVSDLKGWYGPTPLKWGVSASPYFFITDAQNKLRTVTFGNEAGILEAEIKLLAQGR